MAIVGSWITSTSYINRLLTSLVYFLQRKLWWKHQGFSLLGKRHVPNGTALGHAFRDVFRTEQHSVLLFGTCCERNGAWFCCSGRVPNGTALGFAFRDVFRTERLSVLLFGTCSERNGSRFCFSGRVPNGTALGFAFWVVFRT